MKRSCKNNASLNTRTGAEISIVSTTACFFLLIVLVSTSLILSFTESVSAEQFSTAPIVENSAPAPHVKQPDSLSHNELILQNWQATPTEDDLRRHPFLKFRIFANKPLPLVRSFLFLFFVSLVVSEVFPLRLRQARRQCAKNFWKSFWGGILATLVFCTFARAAYFSEIGMPLAQVMIGILQLSLLIGFAVTSNLLGQTLLTMMRVKPDDGSERQWLRRLSEPLVGSLLLSMLLIIPPLGFLPRIGVRLILLFCFLGMGAWFRTGMGTKQLDTTSEI